MELNGETINDNNPLNGETDWPYGTVKVVDEAVQIADGGQQSTFIAKLTDPMTASDAGRNYAQVVLVSGALTVDDTRVSGRALIRYLEEDLVLPDELVFGRRFIRFMEDDIVFFDEFIKSVIVGGGGIIVTKVKDEFITLTDGLVSWVYRRKDFSDLLTILDNTATARSYIKQLTENLILGDSILAYHYWNRRVEDTTTITDQILRALLDVRMQVETIVAGDSTFNWKLRTGMATDNIVVTDELKFWRRIVRLNDDLVTIIDGFIKTLVTGGGIINTRITTEAVELSDSTGRYVTRVTLATEAITFSEQAIKYLTRIRYIAESVDIVDGFATFKIRRSTLSELLDIPDSIVSLYFPSVTYAVRIRIASAVSAVLGYDYDNRVGAEYPNVLCDDEPNLLGSRADNLLGATA